MRGLCRACDYSELAHVPAGREILGRLKCIRLLPRDNGRMVDETSSPAGKKQMAPWLLGLLIAAAIFVVGLLVFTALGYGDDPVIDPDTTGAFLTTLGL